MIHVRDMTHVGGSIPWWDINFCYLSSVHKDRVNRVIKGLKVCFLNIRGLFKHLDELRLFSDEHSPHLICLNETKLDSAVADKEFRLEGFH